MPVIFPILLKFNPAGKLGDTVKEIDPWPPAAVTGVKLAKSIDLTNAVEVTTVVNTNATGLDILRLNDPVPVCPTASVILTI